MESRKPLDSLAVSLMILFCTVMGLQQVALKIVAADIQPVFQIALRSGMAAVLVGILLLVRKENLNLKGGAWRPGIVAGILFSLEYLFAGEGLRHTAASHIAVFLYTAPAFAALGLHWKIPSERLRPFQWLGFAVAFAGIVVAFWGGEGDESGRVSLYGDFLGLLGGMAWGATTVVIRFTKLAHISAAQTLFYQLCGAFCILLVFSGLAGKTSVHITPLVIASLSFQTVVLCFGIFLMWFWLLRTYLASRLGVLAFMTPFFGVLFGVTMLDEPLAPSFVIGAGLVLGGIIMVTGYGWLKQRFM